MGQINTNTTYKAFSPKWVSVDVGLQIGLGGVNITLTGEGSNLGRREGSARCLCVERHRVCIELYRVCPVLELGRVGAEGEGKFRTVCSVGSWPFAPCG